jgi:putative transcriptional regulator
MILGRTTCIVNTTSMIRVKLREAMDAYRQRTGEKLTYELLAQQTGIALTTLQSLATRPEYNTRLSTIEKICVALKCSPGDLLEMSDDSRDT